MLFRRSQEVQRCAAVWQCLLQLLHRRNSLADLLRVGWLGRSALDLFLTLGTCERRHTQNCQQAYNREKRLPLRPTENYAKGACVADTNASAHSEPTLGFVQHGGRRSG